jgi:hypothetical protein
MFAFLYLKHEHNIKAELLRFINAFIKRIGRNTMDLSNKGFLNILTSDRQGFRRHCCRNVIRFLIIISAFILLQACYSKQIPVNGSVEPSDKSIPKEVLESQEAFAARNPKIVSQYGGLNIVVRMATKSELPPNMSKMASLLAAEGAGALTLGIATTTIFSSALLVGGVFLIPAGTYFYFHEKKVWEAISGTMSNTELTLGISKSIHNRLAKQFTYTNAPKLKAEIIVKAFGLVKSGGQHCLIISADCIFSRNSVEVGRELIKITKINRSEDAPPPQCAHLDRFAKHDAKLLKVHLNECKKVLAAMAVERLVKVSE